MTSAPPPQPDGPAEPSTAAPVAAAPSEAGPASERHRAPALWLVVLGIVATGVIALKQGAGAGAAALSGVLVCAAVARLIGRGRRPEGIAVRSTWVDVLMLLALAAGVGALMLAPGVG